jgi:hypothetical protein
MTGNPSLICVREGLPTSRPERYLRASHNPDCRAKSEANAGMAPRHTLAATEFAFWRRERTSSGIRCQPDVPL